MLLLLLSSLHTEQTETQRSEVTCPRSPSWSVAEMRSRSLSFFFTFSKLSTSSGLWSVLWDSVITPGS